jgi:hypothetical protein
MHFQPSHVGADVHGLAYHMHHPKKCGWQTTVHTLLTGVVPSRCVVGGGTAQDRLSRGAKPPGRTIWHGVDCPGPCLIGSLMKNPAFIRENCDKTTSEMRGLSHKIISGDSRWSENVQTHTYKHTIPNMKFKLKLLQIKCNVLGFTKYKAQNVL